MRKILATLLALGLVTSFAHAEETIDESAKATGKKMARKVKKGKHRVQEAFCAEGDLKCAAEKAKHRAEETGDAIGDKAKEIKDKVD